MDIRLGKVNMKKFILFTFLSFLFLTPFNTQAETATVYRIQSLFLYNFTKHIKWESNANEFTVGIYGGEYAFAEIKKNLENKTVWGKKVKILRIASAEDVSQCQIVYLPKSNKKKVLDIIDSANFNHKLLVTEDDLIDNGAAISFVYQKSKLNFKISKSKIEQAGLKVSSSLLSIGIPV